MASTEQITKYNNRIVTTAMKQGVPQVNAKIIAAQAAYETGDFKSNNFLTNNNAFGMAVPKVRKTPYIIGGCDVTAPESEGKFCYAKYASLEDSVKDIVHWLKYNKVNWSAVDTPAKYDEWLVSKGYHTGDQYTYTAGLQKYFERIKNIAYKNPKTTVLVILGAAALITGGIYLYYNRKKLA